jgi:hypothetical protein
MASLAGTAKYLGLGEILNSTKALSAGVLSGAGVRIANKPVISGIGRGLLNLSEKLYGGSIYSSYTNSAGLSSIKAISRSSLGFRAHAAWAMGELKGWVGGVPPMQRVARLGMLAGVGSGMGYGAYRLGTRNSRY